MSWSRFEGVIHVDSPKAIFFQSHYWEEGTWFPKSQVRIAKDGDFFHIVEVRDWLTEKNGLLEFSYYSAEHMEAMNAPR